MCYGIEAYGRRREMAGEIKGEITGAVRMSKDIGFSFANTVKKIMTMFKLDEKEAEKAVKEHWDEPAENSSGEKYSKRKKSVRFGCDGYVAAEAWLEAV